MKKLFSENLRRLRKDRQLSQEQLAQIMGVSVQAVSKWECALSYPDVESLPDLAQTFGVSVDALLCGESNDIVGEENGRSLKYYELPDDGVLRVVQFVGTTPLSSDTYNPDTKIPIVIDLKNVNMERGMPNIEIWGSAEIEGDVYGNVNAGGDVNCGNIDGAVNAGDGVICGNIGGAGRAGDDVLCG